MDFLWQLWFHDNHFGSIVRRSCCVRWAQILRRIDAIWWLIIQERKLALPDSWVSYVWLCWPDQVPEGWQRNGGSSSDCRRWFLWWHAGSLAEDEVSTVVLGSFGGKCTNSFLPRICQSRCIWQHCHGWLPQSWPNVPSFNQTGIWLACYSAHPKRLMGSGCLNLRLMRSPNKCCWNRISYLNFE